jgi:hypothetical protein
MTDSESETLTKLWQAGVPLARSWQTYAHPSVKAEWKKLWETSYMETLAANAKELSKTDLSASEKILQAFTEPNKIMQARSELMSKMQSNILGYIRDGHLFALGFEPPRTLSAAPVEIPLTLWSGKPNWETSTLSAQGLTLIEVRLTTKRIRAEITEISREELNPTAKPVGRPTIRPQIVAAYHAVQTSGPCLDGMHVKSVAGLVREQLARSCPELQVTAEKPSYEAIRRVISPLLKKNNKQ